MTIKKIFLLIIVSGISVAKSQQITLQQAIEMSLANSKTAAIKNLQVDNASAALLEAKQRKLPNASISGSYLQLNSAKIDLKTKNPNPQPAPKVSNAMYGTLNLNLPVYSGGKLKYGIKAAEMSKQAFEYDAEYEKQNVVETTVELYADLYKAHNALKLVEENLQRSMQREKDFANLEKNGIIPRNDLLKANLQTASIELSLLETQNNISLANVNMDLLLGLPQGTEINTDSTEFENVIDLKPVSEYIDSALKNRFDIKSSNSRTKAGEYNLRSVKAEKIPSLALTGGYIAAYIPKVLTVTNAMNIGIGLSYNISSLFKNKAREIQAASTVSQMKLQSELLKDKAITEVSKNYFDVVKSLKKIEVLKKSVEQSSENYRIVKNKYNNNLSTLSDLLEADVAELQSNLDLTVAKADAFVAYNRLLRSAGKLNIKNL